MAPDFEPKVKTLIQRIPSMKDKLSTEESTKNSLIMPMINYLGYNVFDPEEVNPEYNADFGVKNKEKVDYAIMKDGQPIILIECKPVNTKLGEKQCSQLYRYFSVCPAKIGILTNGIEYRFYSDLEEENKMDKKPFLKIDLENLRDDDIAELSKFSKDVFDTENILSQGQKLKDLNEVTTVLLGEIENPSDEFVKVIGRKVYDGLMNQKAIDKYRLTIRDSFSQIIKDKINSKLQEIQKTVNEESTSAAPVSDDKEEIVTTEEELMGFAIIRAIGSKIIPVERITLRDSMSYCSVFCDDNNRKPIAKLHFNSPTVKYVTTFDKDGKDTKNKIEQVQDLYKFQDQILEAISRYVQQ